LRIAFSRIFTLYQHIDPKNEWLSRTAKSTAQFKDKDTLELSVSTEKDLAQFRLSIEPGAIHAIGKIVAEFIRGDVRDSQVRAN